MPTYKRQDDDIVIPTPEQLEQEPTNNQQKPITDPAEQTWQKRYGDLRRHQQQEQDTTKKKIADLERQLADSTKQQIAFPKTEAEIDSWAKKYPDVAQIVQTIAMREAKKSLDEVNVLRTEVTKSQAQVAKERAQLQLHQKHPDFFNDIRHRPDFATWIKSKSQRMQDALFVNETDPTEAAEVISLYKLEVGQKKPAKTPVDPKGAASAVTTRSSTPTPALNRQYEFSESQIDKMSTQEYSQHEVAITKAWKEGKVLMDVSGGAR